MESVQREPNKLIQFVVKVSKYCNLRCAYCYEYNELSHKRVIAPQQMQQVFAHINDYASAQQCRKVDFIWHGGEPFMVDLKYYQQLAAMQQAQFPSSLTVTNNVQTNMTVLTPRQLEFLRERQFFHGIGMSFDVYGDQRLDIKGKLRTQDVLNNMQKLLDAKIPFGAITVLARNTFEHIEKIYQFYDSIGIACRFLPIYRGISSQQIDTHSLSPQEIEYAFKRLFQLWQQSENATPIEPLNRYLDYALSYLHNDTNTTPLYDKYWDEQTFMVNTDGSVWGTSETYDPEYRYGNLFSQDLDSILHSPQRLRAVQASQQRVAKYCASCPYQGHCDGKYVGEATPPQEQQMASNGCLVRNILQHITPKLEQQLEKPLAA